eukprot:2692524-Prymnesium_polylepis.1
MPPGCSRIPDYAPRCFTACYALSILMRSDMAVGLSGCLSGLSGLSDRLSGLSDFRTRSRTCGRA